MDLSLKEKETHKSRNEWMPLGILLWVVPD